MANPFPLFNFHPGAHLDSGLDAGTARCAETINTRCAPRPREITMTLETPAGPEGWALKLARPGAVAHGERPALPEIEAIDTGL